jgi:hypothetical protein
VNARSYDLVVTLRDILGMLPEATAISCYAFKAWTYVLIAASTDAAVRALGQDLGLGAPEIRSARTTWWLRAMSESGHGEVRVEVAGPHHQGPPPAR